MQGDLNLQGNSVLPLMWVSRKSDPAAYTGGRLPQLWQPKLPLQYRARQRSSSCSNVEKQQGGGESNGWVTPNHCLTNKPIMLNVLGKDTHKIEHSSNMYQKKGGRC